MPPHTGRIYDRTDPMGIIVRDTALDIREESIYRLLGVGRHKARDFCGFKSCRLDLAAATVEAIELLLN